MVDADGCAKGIVFSQFTSFLDLIKYSLEMVLYLISLPIVYFIFSSLLLPFSLLIYLYKQSGVKCVQLVGSMSLVERERAISTFTEDANCKIFLMSLKAGGVALNLTVASHVRLYKFLVVCFALVYFLSLRAFFFFRCF